MSISIVVFIFVFHLTISCASSSSAPKLAPVLDSQVSNANSSFQVFCSVREGQQPFFFEWYKNKQAIKSAPGFKWTIDSSKIFSTLTIERIDKEDAGNYSCSVKNIHGSDSINVALTVKGII